MSNQLLIALQCPGATRVAGFKAWLNLGYCVRRGETALRIWMPIPPSKRELEAWRKAGSPAGEKPRTKFRLGPVFDRSQVQELPPPAEPVPLDPPITTIDGDDLAWAMGPLVTLVGELGCEVVIERMPDGHGGYFDPFTKTIGLNEARAVNHQVKTLVHEVGHALIRQLNAEHEDERVFSYSEEELVVESIAFTVCGTLGLDTSGYSIPYLASWSEQADLDTIQQAARVIDQIAKRVEDKVIGPERDEVVSPGGGRSCAPEEHTAQTA